MPESAPNRTPSPQKNPTTMGAPGVWGLAPSGGLGADPHIKKTSERSSVLLSPSSLRVDPIITHDPNPRHSVHLQLFALQIGDAAAPLSLRMTGWGGEPEPKPVPVFSGVMGVPFGQVPQDEGREAP